MPKKFLGLTVYEAAKSRISFTFDNFRKIYVSFSGGKDSTVMLHMVMEEAIRRKRKVGLFFVDWECQFTVTIEHIKSMFDLYKDYIEPYWIALPITTDNACSMYEPVWRCWDEDKEMLWVRDKPEIAISKKDYFPFYYSGMTFEEFTPLFAEWYANGEPCANFVGIRTGESLNRFRAISRDKETYCEKMWTTRITPGGNAWSAYPIYDWHVDDIWTYNGKFKKPYNSLYDRMAKAGLTLHQMRIDEPFGDTSRRGLWLYQVIEPEMWAKIVGRVAGANVVNEHGRTRGNILGNYNISLPEGHTWKSFALYLLNTMPPKTAEHYKNKIAKYLFWYKTRGYPDGIPDNPPEDLDRRNLVPSWKRVCKTLLGNDYWCRWLGFSITKSSNFDNYMKLMRRKRKEWGIFKPNKNQKNGLPTKK